MTSRTYPSRPESITTRPKSIRSLGCTHAELLSPHTAPPEVASFREHAAVVRSSTRGSSTSYVDPQTPAPFDPCSREINPRAAIADSSHWPNGGGGNDMNGCTDAEVPGRHPVVPTQAMTRSYSKSATATTGPSNLARLLSASTQSPQLPKAPISRNKSTTSLSGFSFDKHEDRRRSGGISTSLPRNTTSLDRRRSIPNIVGSPPRTSTLSSFESDIESLRERERGWGSGRPVPKPPTPKRTEDRGEHRLSLSHRMSTGSRARTSSGSTVPTNPRRGSSGTSEASIGKPNWASKAPRVLAGRSELENGKISLDTSDLSVGSTRLSERPSVLIPHHGSKIFPAETVSAIDTAVTSASAITPSSATTIATNKPEYKSRPPSINRAHNGLDRRVSLSSLVRSPSRGTTSSRVKNDNESLKERERGWGRGRPVPNLHAGTPKSNIEIKSERCSSPTHPPSERSFIRTPAGSIAPSTSASGVERRSGWTPKLLYLKPNNPEVQTTPAIGRMLPSRESPVSKEADYILSVAFPPIGTTVVIGSSERVIYAWDLQHRRCIGASEGRYHDSLTSVAFSPDGRRIASASKTNGILLWDMFLNAPLAGPFLRHSASIDIIAFSPNGANIVSASSDFTICVCGAHDGSLKLGPLTGHTNTIQSVSFSPDGTRVVSASSDHTVHVWSSHDASLVSRSFEGHTGPVQSAVFSPDGVRIASGSSDFTVRLWNADTGRPILHPFVGHIGVVKSVAFSPDGSRIVSGSSDFTVRVWDSHTGATTLGPLEGHVEAVRLSVFSPDGTQIISGSRDSIIRVWDSQTGIPIRILNPLEGSKTALYTILSSRGRVGSDTHNTSIAGSPSQLRPSTTPISSQMCNAEIFQQLLDHGCRDMSLLVDSNQYSPTPILGGAFGDIWKGKLHDGTEVAVKAWRLGSSSQRNPKMLKRATREIYNWSRLKHENIQELMGVVMHYERPAMVSLWQNNGNLRDFVFKHPEFNRYKLCVQLATGVSYLHSTKMVHGDLKATNILVSQDYTLKLSDFDHSIMSDCSLAFTETTNLRGGTTRWMAPELILDDKSCRNEETDIYALGMTMLEVITGTSPYSQYKEDAHVIMAIIGKKLPNRPTGFFGPNARDDQMWELLLKCWDRMPSSRPKASELLELVELIAVV